MRVAVLLAAVVLTLAGQTPAGPKKSLVIPAGAEARPGFDAGAATRAYLTTMAPAQKARSDAYFEGGYWLILWDFLYSAAISMFLLNTRLSARIRDVASRFTHRAYLATWFYWMLYSIVIFFLGLPLAAYEGFVREHSYGLSNQSFGAWFGDELKGLALVCVLGGQAVAMLFAAVRKLPRTWHVWGAILTFAFLAIGIVIGPVFIAPMFNKYSLLSDASIRDPILRLAHANGIPAAGVYQVDASRQSNRVSANVSGLLGTERITLNDNLLNRASPQAVLAVMGHEMGHYVMNHVYKALMFFLIVIVIFFWALRRLLEWSLARWGQHWRIAGASDPAVIPLAALILAALSFVFTPAGNTFVRTQEYEADIFGLNASRQPDGFAEAALLLGEYRKLDPSPLEEFIFFDHPSGRTRIYSAMRWKAENQ